MESLENSQLIAWNWTYLVFEYLFVIGRRKDTSVLVRLEIID